MMIDFQVTPGDTFWMVADKVIQECVNMDQPVRLEFNGVELVANPTDTQEQLFQRYLSGYDLLWEAYRASPAGKAAAERAQMELLTAQAKHDQLMDSLAHIAGDEAVLMNWLQEYSDAADHVLVVKDFPRVWSILEVHGYVENDCVGLPKQDYENTRIMARYIAGQAINCMKSINLGPHPITKKMVMEYNQLIEETILD